MRYQVGQKNESQNIPWDRGKTDHAFEIRKKDVQKAESHSDQAVIKKIYIK